SSRVRNCASSKPPVASFRYRAMKGTVDPASRRETAAATCWGPTASSVAIRASMDCIGTEGFSETGAHYAEHTQVQQDLRFPRAWRKEALAAAPEVGPTATDARTDTGHQDTAGKFCNAQ